MDGLTDTAPPTGYSAGDRARLRELVAARYGCHCVWCGHVFALVHWATLEHLVPRRFGGDHSIENLRLACKECNEDRESWYRVALKLARGRVWLHKAKRYARIDPRNGL